MHFSADHSAFLGVALLALPSVAAPVPAPVGPGLAMPHARLFPITTGGHIGTERVPTVPSTPKMPQDVQGSAVRISGSQRGSNKELGAGSPHAEKRGKTSKVISGLGKAGNAANALTGLVQTGESLWDAGKEAFNHIKGKGGDHGASEQQGSGGDNEQQMYARSPAEER